MLSTNPIAFNKCRFTTGEMIHYFEIHADYNWSVFYWRPAVLLTEGRSNDILKIKE